MTFLSVKAFATYNSGCYRSCNTTGRNTVQRQDLLLPCESLGARNTTLCIVTNDRPHVVERRDHLCPGILRRCPCPAISCASVSSLHGSNLLLFDQDSLAGCPTRIKSLHNIDFSAIARHCQRQASASIAALRRLPLIRPPHNFPHDGHVFTTTGSHQICVKPEAGAERVISWSGRLSNSGVLLQQRCYSKRQRLCSQRAGSAKRPGCETQAQV